MGFCYSGLGSKNKRDVCNNQLVRGQGLERVRGVLGEKRNHLRPVMNIPKPKLTWQPARA